MTSATSGEPSAAAGGGKGKRKGKEKEKEKEKAKANSTGSLKRKNDSLQESPVAAKRHASASHVPDDADAIVLDPDLIGLKVRLYLLVWFEAHIRIWQCERCEKENAECAIDPRFGPCVACRIKKAGCNLQPRNPETGRGDRHPTANSPERLKSYRLGLLDKQRERKAAQAPPLGENTSPSTSLMGLRNLVLRGTSSTSKPSGTPGDTPSASPASEIPSELPAVPPQGPTRRTKVRSPLVLSSPITATATESAGPSSTAPTTTISASAPNRQNSDMGVRMPVRRQPPRATSLLTSEERGVAARLRVAESQLEGIEDRLEGIMAKQNAINKRLANALGRLRGEITGLELQLALPFLPQRSSELGSESDRRGQKYRRG
jgi:hypothetical protein